MNATSGRDFKDAIYQGKPEVSSTAPKPEVRGSYCLSPQGTGKQP
jgi:hypothetical protein